MPLTSDSDGDNLITPGKHLLLKVPDYDPSTAGNQTSFVRIGYPNVPWTQEEGADLVKLAYIVGPAGKVEDTDIKSRFTSAKLADGTTDNPEFDQSLIDLVKKYGAGFFPPFIDDQRERGTTGKNPAGSLGHGLTPAHRKLVSDALQSKCGWRDHSDGNRITTTRGDKIEVIQGNYKLIVMGRQPDPTQGMGWEASGNNVQDYAGATMPGASVTVTWIQEAYIDPVDVPALQASFDALTLEADTTIPARIAQIDARLQQASTYHGGKGGNAKSEKEKLTAEKAQLESRRHQILTVEIPAAEKAIQEGNDFNAGYKGGAWLLQNSTERVYQYSRNAGNFMSQEWGDLRETYTGSENPVRVGKHEDDGLQGHPSDHTIDPSPQATEPFPRTSSVGLPRGNPRIIEKTWAEKIESYTGSKAWRIPSVHEETWVHEAYDETHADSITSKTYADEMSETTHCTGTISSKTYAAATTELVAAAAIESHTTAAQITSVTETLNQIDLFIGASHVNVELALGMLDVFLGFKKEFSFDQDYTALKKKEATLKRLETSLSKQLIVMNHEWVSAKTLQSCLETTVKALKVSIG